MFKQISVLGCIIVLLMGLSSCERFNASDVGELKITINQQAAIDAMLKSTVVVPDTGIPIDYQYFLMFSIETTSGTLVFEDEMVPLSPFGNSFVSPSVELNVGKYRLVKLFVVNGYGAVIMAAPMQESELAYLVSQPLPIEFSISENSVSQLTPEVLITDGTSPFLFGYAGFEVFVVTPLSVFVTLCGMELPVDASQPYSGTVLKVTGSDGWSHEFVVVPGVNKLFLKDNVASYTFEWFNDVQELTTMAIALDELSATSYDQPLVLCDNAEPYQKLVLQPNAQEGIDATIVDLSPTANAGDNPYFEAGWASEPILAVMRTTRSLIRFDGMANLPDNAVVKKVLLTLWLDWQVMPMAEGGTADIYYWSVANLEPIVEPWNEDEVTWANQPSTDPDRQVPVYIDPTLSTNMRTYDVTSLMTPSADGTLMTDGMMLSVSSGAKDVPSTLRFASSDNEVMEMHPMLTVYYQLPEE